MIIKIVKQNPGQMEQSTKDYKGYKYRTVVFHDDWVDAMFFEVNNQLIGKWKAGETVTSTSPQEYSSFNCALIPRNFTVIYHNEKGENK